MKARLRKKYILGNNFLHTALWPFLVLGQHHYICFDDIFKIKSARALYITWWCLHLMCVGFFKKASWNLRAETCYRRFCMIPCPAPFSHWLPQCVWTGSGTGTMTRRKLCCSPDSQPTVSV